mmetsp:Transcript_6315/g.25626  ORF Transcript_6315/g.25626 Transcript_6315/m.25626 type:complete len:378 (+) Transcript_6315:2469-3602(+)
MGAREKYSARPAWSVTSLTTFGFANSSGSVNACAAVAITQSVCAVRVAAQALIMAGAISGSSPCTLTTTASSGRPNCPTASARRSLPEGWSARVLSACTPCAAQAAMTSGASVATTTWPASDAAARRATWTIIGSPARSASGLLGSRVDASRAGMMTVKLIRASFDRRERNRCAGRVRVPGPGLVFQHQGDAVADRVGQSVSAAGQGRQIGLGAAQQRQRPLAQRADQHLDQSWVHREGNRRWRWASSAAAKPAPGRKSSVTTHTGTAPAPCGGSLTASFSVSSTPAALSGQGRGSRRAWSGSGRGSKSRPRPASMSKKRWGRARPAQASRPGRPRSASKAGMSAARPAHQSASGTAPARRRSARNPGRSVLGCGAL